MDKEEILQKVNTDILDKEKIYKVIYSDYESEQQRVLFGKILLKDEKFLYIEFVGNERKIILHLDTILSITEKKITEKEK